MRIQIQVDEKIEEDEIIIKCSELTEEIQEFQKSLTDMMSRRKEVIFYKGDTEYYLSLGEILFFETEDNGISAHTIDSVYQVKYKLYELEELLPRYFVRVSKSTILNIHRIYSMTRSISASSTVEFQNTYKKVYVSRYYYKTLKSQLNEKRK